MRLGNLEGLSMVARGSRSRLSKEPNPAFLRFWEPKGGADHRRAANSIDYR